MDPKLIQEQMATNPLVKLQMTDQNMIATLIKNQDPKLAETMMQNKLKKIGLDDKEIAIMFIKYGMGYTLEQACQNTGLSVEQLNNYHDTALDKVNKFISSLNSGPALGNIFDVFKK